MDGAGQQMAECPAQLKGWLWKEWQSTSQGNGEKESQSSHVSNGLNSGVGSKESGLGNMANDGNGNGLGNALRRLLPFVGEVTKDAGVLAFPISRFFKGTKVIEVIHNFSQQLCPFARQRQCGCGSSSFLCGVDAAGK